MDVLHNFFSTLSLIRSQFGPCFVSMCWLKMLLSIFLVKKLWLYLRQRFPFFCLCSEGRPPDLITVFHLSLDDCVCHLKENNGLSQNPAKAIWTQYDTSTVKCSPADANNSYSLRILAMFYICWLKYTHIYRWTHTLGWFTVSPVGINESFQLWPHQVTLLVDSFHHLCVFSVPQCYLGSVLL